MKNDLKIAKINQLHLLKSEKVGDCNYTVSTVTSYYSLICRSGKKYVDVLNNDRVLDGKMENKDVFGNYYEIDTIFSLPKKRNLIRKLHI